PRFGDRAVHVGSAAGFDYVVVPGYAREGRDSRTYVGTVYVIRKAPGGFLDRIGDTFGFLRHYWWQLLLGGALAAGIALTIARFLALGMTRPLRDMARAAGKMARGDYGQRVATG